MTFIMGMIRVTRVAIQQADMGAFVFKVADKNISSTHVTLLFTLENLMTSIPKLYAFRIVDKYDVYWPNV